MPITTTFEACLCHLIAIIVTMYCPMPDLFSLFFSLSPCKVDRLESKDYKGVSRHIMGIHWAVCIAHLELPTSPTLLLMCIQGKKLFQIPKMYSRNLLLSVCSFYLYWNSTEICGNPAQSFPKVVNGKGSVTCINTWEMFVSSAIFKAIPPGRGCASCQIDVCSQLPRGHFPVDQS